MSLQFNPLNLNFFQGSSLQLVNISHLILLAISKAVNEAVGVCSCAISSLASMAKNSNISMLNIVAEEV